MNELNVYYPVEDKSKLVAARNKKEAALILLTEFDEVYPEEEIVSIYGLSYKGVPSLLQ